MAYLKKTLGKMLRSRLIASAYGNYRSYPNVIGVGYGLKYSEGKPTGEEGVQFFVTRKVKDKARLVKVLPDFVYGRRRSGLPNYQQKVAADVIPLLGLELCSRAGAGILKGLNHAGTTTLVFRNKTPSSPKTYFLTCAHVSGTFAPLSDSPSPTLTVGGEDPGGFDGKVIARTTHAENRVEFDIALGEPDADSTVSPDLAVQDSDTVLTGFAARDSYPPNTELACRMAASGTRTLKVVSRDSLTIEGLRFRGERYTFDNVIPAQGDIVRGDSGGILFLGDKAVGILVARATNGWALFHPLKEAVAHLNTLTAVDIKCFSADGEADAG